MFICYPTATIRNLKLKQIIWEYDRGRRIRSSGLQATLFQRGKKVNQAQIDIINKSEIMEIKLISKTSELGI